jgi:hypothetical protein
MVGNMAVEVMGIFQLNFFGRHLSFNAPTNTEETTVNHNLPT